MSLTPKQEEDTRRELRENFEKSNVTVEQIASDLGTSVDYIEQLFRLEPIRYEDTWILKNYLLEKVNEAGNVPTLFTALGGDYRRIWFLDSDYIDGKRIHRSFRLRMESQCRQDSS